MGENLKRAALNSEEQRTVKLFITLFYIISISYDTFYYYILPKFVYPDRKIGFPEQSLGLWMYAVEFALIPFAVYLVKINRSHLVKYIYILTFVMINIINELLIYFQSDEIYQAGNIVELFIILFSPIFVNKRFFLVVLTSIISKYLIVGLIIGDTRSFFPIILLLFFGVFAYILLNRFQGYVKAVEQSYSKQIEGIVSGIITSLELKDPYTRGHSQRVANYSLILAEKTGRFTKEELQSFNYACLLHDIGKVNIPDTILMKPGRLTDEEFEIIKTHPTVGGKAVKAMDGLEWCVDVVRFHHERWDGSGYPDGLRGEAIPYTARIAAIADAFDAMTTSRSYRSALPSQTAYERIVEGSGTQFDPQLVEVFKSVYLQWVKIVKSDEVN
ncbi:HD-GYP domain-containing protein [Bacillus taeanensis]|uniref:Metal-dependent phosphohydrolase n=1 Tax=Bacillus taeanensis TaxID=273032 RepID=A0A366XP99_9BACI|nr:HD-GYP domain-containing protein [Bacillus taeanensis]RBW68190.1 metal-dependent phosphohydrolase [Bacillus taeanensis]